eukprot:TRINITY_DN1430_c0_g1_i1.p1 TRINITY_DN1430_c0_g1~~TRINITY_DN1430_c0_g1_i1.p1  ORF type:complete len:413 (+),score=42.77 TRINITY_DN1430_c0_g1_i1:73-1239(+)
MAPLKGNDLLTVVLVGYVFYRCGELLGPWLRNRLSKKNKQIQSLNLAGHRRKQALLIGCNYPGTKAQLQGCHNDVLQQQALLKEVYGFVDAEITVMLDGRKSRLEPTKANIVSQLRGMVQQSESGDILFLHFSGHGIQIPSEDEDEEDYLDEALVCTDMNLIIDDDLRDIVQQMNPAVKFTMIADCCHSGSMLDGPPAIIKGNKSRDLSLEDLQESREDGNQREVELAEVKNRGLPLEQYKEIIGGDQGVKTRELLSTKCGESTSSRLMEQKRSQQWQLKQEADGKTVDPSLVRSAQLLNEDVGVLITGCQDFETSADASIGKRSFGAMTNALVTVIRHHYRKYPQETLTNEELVLQVRYLLGKSRYAQNPCLECSVTNAQKAYLLLD